jgi:hypothetical protein
LARFLTPTRISYSPAKQRATVETRDFALPQILVEMHARGEFVKGRVLDMAWSVIVDLRRPRFWGARVARLNYFVLYGLCE